jgi:uncharacterized protein (DUF1501 family)
MSSHVKAKVSRRHFLGGMGCGTLAASGLLGSLSQIQRAAAAIPDSAGYKALVCVYLYGGNDSFNWLVPTTTAGYNVYRANRSASIALAQGSMLPLNGTASDGYQYGIHQKCPEIQALFNNNRAAFLCNVGTLVQPTTPAQARASSVKLPWQLFSHIDQQTLWSTSVADSLERYGWAGRIADFYASKGYQSSLPMNINVGGANYLQEGRSTIPYGLGTNGAPILNVTDNGSYRNGSRRSTAQALLLQAQSDANLLVSEYANVQQDADSKVALVNSALAGAGNLATAFPRFDNDGNLGAQLQQVARCIKARSALNSTRQIFFVGMGGFDTHNGLINTHETLLPIVSKNLQSFWDAMGELGTQNNVTLFTASDFGRSIGSNGDGCDHAWGGHHLILGGAVQGGRWYGAMPSLVIGGPDDVGNGRIVPTTSTDQYAATLARWFGVADADLDALFPNLRNFTTNRTLGFFA